MPKRPKISANQRRDWLRRYEDGERQDEIARKDNVNPRTVREGIEKARTERAYENARNEQLRKSLDLHQQDLLDLLNRLKDTIHTPPLKQFNIDYPESELEYRIVLHEQNRILIHPGVYVEMDAGGPVEITLDEEETRLFHCLTEHLAKTTLMRSFAEWKKLLLREQQSRAAIIRRIIQEAESLFNKRVGIADQSAESILTCTLIIFVRVEATQRVMGEHAKDIASRLHTDEDQHDNHHIVAAGTRGRLILDSPYPERDMEKLVWLVDEIARSDEAAVVARCHQDLGNTTQRTRAQLEDHILMHFVPGQCRLCKKLGGQ